MISKLFAQFIKHKIAASLILVAVAAAGYWGYGKIFSNDGAIRYATAQVQKGTLIVSISGSGQVSASNQVDVKPKANGDIVGVYVKQGQEVGVGALIAELDTADAERAVRDAETALETAKLELDKLLEPVDALVLLQSENSFLSAKESKQKAEDNLVKAREDGFNVVANAFLDLPSIMTGLENILFEKTIDPAQDNITWYLNQTSYQNNERDKANRYRDDVYNAYNKARLAYAANFDSYKSASRTSSKETIETLVSETYETTKLIAEAIKATDNYIDFVQDIMELHDWTIPAMVTTHQSNIASYTSKTNSHLLSLLSIKNSLQEAREAVVSAERTIQERELALEKLKKGPDELDIRAKRIAVQQREDALATAKQTLADHYVRAPFAGVIAKVNAKQGDTASVGTAVATLITKQKIAEVSLNEVDAAQVKVGQKVTLTFDAVPDLTVTGQVAEVDAVGTVSQGVVTYTVKISFDTQDDRVKPGMSVSAAIVTEAKPNVLLVPNSAVKSQARMNYVEMPDERDRNAALTANTNGVILKYPLHRQTIEIGTANDEFTEVISGLKEGDLVVTRTIQPNSKQTQNKSSQGGLRFPGLPGVSSRGRGMRTGHQ